MNYAMKFSVTIERITDEEKRWLTETLASLEEEEGLTFEHELGATRLWLHSDERVDDQLLAFLLNFFEERRPKEYLLIDYACTADRPTDDAYGGGTVFVSAHTICWSDLSDWKRTHIGELEKRVGGPVREATDAASTFPTA